MQPRAYPLLEVKPLRPKPGWAGRPMTVSRQPYQQVRPPLTAIVWPVTKAASSLAK